MWEKIFLALGLTFTISILVQQARPGSKTIMRKLDTRSQIVYLQKQNDDY